MSVQVYVISDPLAIDFIQNGDLNGFKEYLDSDDTLYLTEPEEFATEAEALAYCSGIGYGYYERAPVEHYPLRTSEECDMPFIEAIKNTNYLRFFIYDEHISCSPLILTLSRLPKSGKIMLSLQSVLAIADKDQSM